MQIIEIDKRLVPELENSYSELGVDSIYAGSSIDLFNNEYYLYPVFVFRNGVKQKIAIDGDFLLNNDFEIVLGEIKQVIKK